MPSRSIRLVYFDPGDRHLLDVIECTTMRFLCTFLRRPSALAFGDVAMELREDSADYVYRLLPLTMAIPPRCKKPRLCVDGRDAVEVASEFLTVSPTHNQETQP